MADAHGPASDHLSVLHKARGRVREYNLLALLRQAEARAGSLPRIGRSRTPSQNIVDLAHEAGLEFPASTVAEIETTSRGRMRVRSRFLGLTGPMGALPIHLTEYAFYEKRTSEKRPFGRFLDLLTDRMLQFFYRAWADSQPAAQADRPHDDRFAAYLGAIGGVGMAPNPRRASHEEALTWAEQLRYAGLLISRRSAAAIQDGLSHALGTPVRITEFVPRWRDIEPRERTRLGGHGFSQLGVDAVVGGRVCVVEDTFRVAVEAKTAQDYESFLPGRPRHLMAREMLDLLKPSQLDWELQLELNENLAPPARLDGKAALGLVSWVAPAKSRRRRADARIRGG
jgi:type VI secretion system ImpH/TssG family protein